MLNEQFKVALVAEGVNEENLKLLESQELCDVSDFATLQPADLTVVGMKLGGINKVFRVVRRLAAPVASTPAPEVQIPVTQVTPVSLPPVVPVQVAPVAHAPVSSGGGDLGTLFSTLIPPQTPQEAAERLCRAPSDAKSQEYWRQFFGQETLIVSSTPGSIDRDKTMEAVEIWVTSGEAPSELDGVPLLSISEFLQSTFGACPFTGDRIIRGGMSLKTNVHYGFLLGNDVSLSAIQNSPGMNFVAFAAETGKITRDLQTWKTRMLELRSMVQGKDISSPTAIKAAVAGSAWDEVATDYIRDANSGGVVAMRARARLVTQAKRRTVRARNDLSGIGEALTSGFDKVTRQDGSVPRRDFESRG
ncbi:hypothetical protein HYV70_01775 [Candidatus Uhrbacteria bacterium]|nr:hypothetical protein [Candidatus Uhrbacteria bacterium]